MTRLISVIASIALLSCCLQSVTAFNILEDGKRSVLQIFQHAKEYDQDSSTDRPKRDQKSLLIVFDTTGSMGKDLVEMRGGANDIVNNFARRSEQPIFNYVLSLFNDPSKYFMHRKGSENYELLSKCPTSNLNL